MSVRQGRAEPCYSRSRPLELRGTRAQLLHFLLDETATRSCLNSAIEIPRAVFDAVGVFPHFPLHVCGQQLHISSISACRCSKPCQKKVAGLHSRSPGRTHQFLMLASVLVMVLAARKRVLHQLLCFLFSLQRAALPAQVSKDLSACHQQKRIDGLKFVGR